MAKWQRTLQRVFETPAPANIKWTDIEAMLRGLGAYISQRHGSRISVKLNGVKTVLHRSHPNPQAKRSQVRSVREFLEKAGVTP